MIQLNPPLPLQTPRGEGWAHLVTWDSLEHSLYWTVFLDNGQIWTFRNEEVRACKNATAERPRPEVCCKENIPFKEVRVTAAYDICGALGTRDFKRYFW